MRWIVIGGALFFALAFALVAALTPAAPARDPDPGSGAASATPAGVLPVVRLDETAARGAGARSATPPAAAEPAPVRGADEPKVDVDARRRELEPLRREVFRGLRELRPRIAHCDLAGGAVFVTLETLEGGVRVTAVRLEASPTPDARPEDPPIPGPEPALHCVRGALERNVMGAPSARPGRTFEIALEPNALD